MSNRTNGTENPPAPGPALAAPEDPLRETALGLLNSEHVSPEIAQVISTLVNAAARLQSLQVRAADVNLRRTRFQRETVSRIIGWKAHPKVEALLGADPHEASVIDKIGTAMFGSLWEPLDTVGTLSGPPGYTSDELVPSPNCP